MRHRRGFEGIDLGLWGLWALTRVYMYLLTALGVKTLREYEKVPTWWVVVSAVRFQEQDLERIRCCATDLRRCRLMCVYTYVYRYIYIYGTPPRTYLQTCLYTYMRSHFSTHAHTCTHTHTRTHMQRGLVYMKISVYEHGYIIRKRLRIQYHAQQSSLEARLH